MLLTITNPGAVGNGQTVRFADGLRTEFSPQDILVATAEADPLNAPPDGDPVEATSALLEAFRTSVNVKIKTPKQYDIELDFDRLTFENMELLDRAQSGTLTQAEQMAAIKEIIFIISGTDVSTLPLRVTTSILAELKSAMQGMTSPNV